MPAAGEVVAAAEPTIWRQGANHIAAVGKWTPQHLAHHLGTERFIFDVAPKPPTSEEPTFTFTPTYLGDGYQLEDLCACSSPSTPFCQSCNGSAHIKRRLTFDDYSSMAAAGSTILFAKLGPNNLPWELARDLEASSDGFFVDPSKRNRDWDLWVGTEGWRSHTHYDLQVRSGHSGAYDLRA